MSLIDRITRPVRIATIAALAVTAMGAGSATANADEFNGTSLVRWNIPFRDCRITVGPVLDAGNDRWHYRLIGGAQVNCSSRHTSIAVTVREYKSNGSTTWQVGSGVGTTFANSYGFGTKILKLNLGCPGRGYQWTTGAYVTVDGHSPGWYYSPWSPPKEDGC